MTTPERQKALELATEFQNPTLIISNNCRYVGQHLILSEAERKECPWCSVDEKPTLARYQAMTTELATLREALDRCPFSFGDLLCIAGRGHSGRHHDRPDVSTVAWTTEESTAKELVALREEANRLKRAIENAPHEWHCVECGPCAICDWKSKLADPPSQPPSENWIIVFEDPDKDNITFTGAGAQEAARKQFRQSGDNWSCRLFAEVASTGCVDPPCNTCGGTKQVEGPAYGSGQSDMFPCPACQPAKGKQ